MKRASSGSACLPAYRCSGSTHWARRPTAPRQRSRSCYLGAAGIHFIGPISTLIITLLLVVYFSYRQTIAAYPHGGGSYTVAKENLGTTAGLFAAAALLLDYVLVVAVGISAGVGALVSAFTVLQPHTLSLCLLILAMITLVNLRGVRVSRARHS